MPDATVAEPLAFTCPRCGLDVEARFYGPCEECRGALRALGGEQREVVAEAYVPKANVTPNQVATKE